MKINHKYTTPKKYLLSVFGVLGLALIWGNLVTTIVSADSLGRFNTAAEVSASTDTSISTSGTTDTCKANPAHLQLIISKGDAEINRRLATLNTLTAKINAATHLTSADQTLLLNEVSTTTSGLTALKTQLDSETNVCSAVTDAQSIYTEYRVYALVVPKVQLVKVADDQQTVEAQLSSLAQKLQTRITADQNAGKDVSTLQTELDSMNTLVSTSQSISVNIEDVVINLQPSDYNSNHQVLFGDAAQLKTAHQDNMTAFNDAKSIVAALKNL